MESPRPACSNSEQKAAVRRSCQTMAGWIGFPVARSHTMTVSRWLVMPIAAISEVLMCAFAMAARAVSSTPCQISLASCSTQPDWGKIWRNSRWATPRIRPWWSKRMARELVVPWSRARTYLTRKIVAEGPFEALRRLLLPPAAYCELVAPVEPVEPAGAGWSDVGAEVLLGLLSVLLSLERFAESSEDDGVLMLEDELSEPVLALPEDVAGAASEPVEDEDEDDVEGVVASCVVEGVVTTLESGLVALESLVDGLAVSPAKAAVEKTAKATAM